MAEYLTMTPERIAEIYESARRARGAGYRLLLPTDADERIEQIVLDEWPDLTVSRSAMVPSGTSILVDVDERDELLSSRLLGDPDFTISSDFDGGDPKAST